MAIRIVRLGTPRSKDEGLRLGTARRPPRGVRKEHYAKENYFDVWFPDLAPSAPLVSWALSEPWTDRRWARYEKSCACGSSGGAACGAGGVMAWERARGEGVRGRGGR